jgi:hypothetical protein
MTFLPTPILQLTESQTQEPRRASEMTSAKHRGMATHDAFTPSTNGATKLRESDRTDGASQRLNKPDKCQRIGMRRYRTQEVAGSSPASSTHKVPANGIIVSGMPLLHGWLIYLRTSLARLS